VESSKVVDLEMFVARGDVDPIYFNSPYYLYPDGQMAVETVRVIGAAMAEAGVVGIGRLTLSRRERMIMVEPRGTGMVLITLRVSDEVRASPFTKADRDGAIDAEMLAICPCNHRAADREIRSEQVPRPLPGGVAGADRGQDEGGCHHAASDLRAVSGH